MADMHTDVLVAAYQDVDAASRDFDALMQAVEDKQVQVEGAILVTHDADGAVKVVQHGDHLGRKGLGWGAGAGLVVGLFAPPLLASVVVGGGAGGLIGKFAERKVSAGMEGLAEKLPPGTAGVITVFDDEHRLAVEQALAGSPAKSVAQTDKDGIRALKAELATAMDKFVQDRSELPIPDRVFGGTAGRTLKGLGGGLGDDPGAEGARGGTERAALHHRRRGVRLDRHVRRPDQHADLLTRAEDGRDLQQLPRDRRLLPDARRAA